MEKVIKSVRKDDKLNAFGLFLPLYSYDKKDPMIKKSIEIVENLINKIDELVDKGEVEYLGLYYHLGAAMSYCLAKSGMIKQTRHQFMSLHEIAEMKQKIEHQSWSPNNFLDHYIWEGGVLTTHPYSLNNADIEVLLKVCKELDLAFDIDGYSQYFPGHTFRLSIYKRK